MDFFFSEEGDIKLSPSADIALADKPWRDDAQQAYIRTMTDIGDFLLYPRLGSELKNLFGMPQNRETAEAGKNLIQQALDREGRFVGKNITIDAVPTGPQTIRFDIYIVVGSRQELILSIEQELGIV